MHIIFAFLISILHLLLGHSPIPDQGEEEYPLSEKLKEISGLELLNDSTLIAFNDGGNKSELYLLSLEGDILRTVNVLDTKNRDWEDIAIDDKYVYIGDIGNNKNDRENLAILKVKIDDILEKDAVPAQKIKFNYKEQKVFPPDDASLFYDAEGMTICNDSIFIFTKDRSQPFQGLSLVYKLPLEPGKYEVEASHRITIGKDGWWKDGVTAADYYNGQFYLLTYNRYIVYDFVDGAFEKSMEHTFNGMTQRESIVVLNEEAIFVADEQNPIVGDVRLYKISLP
ncbi:hypothetical protein N9Y60_02970 [Crocinitomicaceae bacterium]|nr:hypothetical protein [Crocinitomicaceae bacterium]MDB3906082.1 hypothetical protein [Crocinitomicaceae bacterium]